MRCSCATFLLSLEIGTNMELLMLPSRLLKPQAGVAYPSGQFFFHKVLGYRGVVLMVCTIV